MKWNQHISRRKRRGSYTVLIALLFVVLLGFSALAIDVSYLNLVRVQAQNAADAGSHAALVEYTWSDSESSARTASIEVINANLLAGEAADASDDDIVFGGWDFDERTFDAGANYTNAVTADVRMDEDSVNGELELKLVEVFGQIKNQNSKLGTAGVNGQSVGAYRFRDIFIVLDVTLSFGEEIDQTREALLALLDLLGDRSFPKDRIGLIAFTAEAAVYTDLSYIAENYSTIRSDWESIFLCSGSWMGVDCWADPTGRGAGTDHAVGLDLAIEELTAARSDNVGALQTIILISDGVPYCVDNCDWGGCFGAIRTEAYDYAQYAVDDEHISIFPVSFYDPDGMSLDSDSCSDVDTAKDDQSAFMESLGAEFETGYGEFFETTDADELSEILEVIGRTVPVALVE